MKTKPIVSAVLLAVTAVASSQALAQPAEIGKRCEEDYLSPDQARSRVEWYAKNYPQEIAAVLASKTARNVTQEQATAWFLRTMLEDPIFGGPALRPTYPTFTLTDYTNPAPKYFGPVDPAAAANKPANYFWTVTCLSSCYKPGVAVLFAREGGGFEDVAINEALHRSIPKVATLSDESTLQSPQLTAHNVAFYVESLTETDHDIFQFKMASGGELQITEGHPLIDGAGRIREARTFGVGDKLVRADGTQDPIVDISYEAYHGRVYNIMPNTASLLGQVVVANGYLSGSAWYQNNGLRLLNRTLLRGSLPADVLQ